MDASTWIFPCKKLSAPASARTVSSTKVIFTQRVPSASRISNRATGSVSDCAAGLFSFHRVIDNLIGLGRYADFAPKWVVHQRDEADHRSDGERGKSAKD